MVQVIPLKYGRVFKRVFGKLEVFNQFVSDVLGIAVNVDTIHTEYEYPEPIGFVHSRYDLFAEDKQKRIVIEIQHLKEPDFFDRFLYYHIISMVEQVRNYQAYWFERAVYTIVVLTSIPQDGSIDFSCAVSDFNPVDEYQRRLMVYPHRLIFLAPRKASALTPPNIAKWLNFITDSLDGEMQEDQYTDPLFHSMLDDMRRNTMSPEELADIIDETAWEQAQSLFAAAGRAEGLAEGMVKGQMKIVQTMLERGATVEQIIQLTGIAIEDIEKMQVSHPVIITKQTNYE